MHEKIEKGLEKIENLKGFEEVQFIILYGSAAEGRMNRESDISATPALRKSGGFEGYCALL